jgi:hypothetical protein
MQDGDRCKALFAEHDGIVLDYSRQNVTLESMVRYLHFILTFPSYFFNKSLFRIRINYSSLQMLQDWIKNVQIYSVESILTLLRIVQVCFPSTLVSYYSFELIFL